MARSSDFAATQPPSGGRRGRALALLLALGSIPTLTIGCSPSEPSDPLATVSDGVLDLFATHDVVCLGEEHGHRGDAALRLAVVENPRFADTVDIVLVEFLNPLHQSTIDRLVLAGETLTREEIRPAWRDAGLGVAWESPLYEDFLRSVAALNRTLPPQRRIPVLGGSAPVPWPEIRRASDLLPWLDRRALFAQRIRTTLLDPGLRGLAVYGAGHCEAAGMGFRRELEIPDRARVAAVRSLPARSRQAARERGWPLDHRPGWIPVQGTDRALEPAGDLFFEGHAFAGLSVEAIADGIVDFGASDPGRDLTSEADLPIPRRLEAARRAKLLREAVSMSRPPEGGGP